MDPVSQASLGASLSQSFAKDKSQQFGALVIGALSGMAPDLDVFINSDTDPLLFLEFHRQFGREDRMHRIELFDEYLSDQQ